MDIPGPSNAGTYAQWAHVVECPICYNIYDKPMQMGCGHTLCSSCIGRLVDQVKSTMGQEDGQQQGGPPPQMRRQQINIDDPGALFVGLGGFNDQLEENQFIDVPRMDPRDQGMIRGMIAFPPPNNRRPPGATEIKCPECRKPTMVPPDGLPVNYRVQEIVQKVTPLFKDRHLIKHCNQCEEVLAQGVYFDCNQCTENAHKICPTCAIRSHNGHDLVERKALTSKDVRSMKEKIDVAAQAASQAMENLKPRLQAVGGTIEAKAKDKLLAFIKIFENMINTFDSKVKETSTITELMEEVKKAEKVSEFYKEAVTRVEDMLNSIEASFTTFWAPFESLKQEMGFQIEDPIVAPVANNGIQEAAGAAEQEVANNQPLDLPMNGRLVINGQVIRGQNMRGNAQVRQAAGHFAQVARQRRRQEQQAPPQMGHPIWQGQPQPQHMPGQPQPQHMPQQMMAPMMGRPPPPQMMMQFQQQRLMEQMQMQQQQPQHQQQQQQQPHQQHHQNARNMGGLNQMQQFQQAHVPLPPQMPPGPYLQHHQMPRRQFLNGPPPPQPPPPQAQQQRHPPIYYRPQHVLIQHPPIQINHNPNQQQQQQHRPPQMPQPVPVIPQNQQGQQIALPDAIIHQNPNDWEEAEAENGQDFPFNNEVPQQQVIDPIRDNDAPIMADAEFRAHFEEARMMVHMHRMPNPIRQNPAPAVPVVEEVVMRMEDDQQFGEQVQVQNLDAENVAEFAQFQDLPAAALDALAIDDFQNPMQEQELVGVDAVEQEEEQAPQAEEAADNDVPIVDRPIIVPDQEDEAVEEETEEHPATIRRAPRAREGLERRATRNNLRSSTDEPSTSTGSRPRTPSPTGQSVKRRKTERKPKSEEPEPMESEEAVDQPVRAQKRRNATSTINAPSSTSGPSTSAASGSAPTTRSQTRS